MWIHSITSTYFGFLLCLSRSGINHDSKLCPTPDRRCFRSTTTLGCTENSNNIIDNVIKDDNDSSNNNNDNNSNNNDKSDPMFEESLVVLGFSESVQQSIHAKLEEENIEGSCELMLLAQDFFFSNKPEAFSKILQQDFGFAPLLAHRVRAAVMHGLRSRWSGDCGGGEMTPIRTITASGPNAFNTIKTTPPTTTTTNGNNNDSTDNDNTRNEMATATIKRMDSFKSLTVNANAKLRRKNNEKATTNTTGAIDNNYGLPKNYAKIYTTLAEELEEFWSFMTSPSTIAQEPTIRSATAKTYMRHAKLFLGWYLNTHNNMATTASNNHHHQYNNDTTISSGRNVDDNINTSTTTQNNNNNNISLLDIIPDKEKETANRFIQFIVWLRNYRYISASYEANILRGISKLLKFRFAKESTTDPSYGDKTFDDIPVIKEIRKLHLEANKRASLAPRSSNEEKKWLSWEEYLGVIKHLKQDLDQEITNYHAAAAAATNDEKPKKKNYSSGTTTTTKRQRQKKRMIANMYQQYLILAFFTNVPDRQRTVRELQIHKSLVRGDPSSITSSITNNKNNNLWIVKHSADDYKTGKAYGDRPPLILSHQLSTCIDDYIQNWRPCLLIREQEQEQEQEQSKEQEGNSNNDHLFVKFRTCQPLTGDDIYRIVAQNCYKYSGKRTNPHLLRDMIVTHVRNSNSVSEKQLEALALYMGHSMDMQRTSYDRRTLDMKVAPAVELLETMNK